MRSTPLFKPGDIAVLRNAVGGRIFKVYSVDGEKLTEEAWIPSQQKFMLEVWANQLIAVRDEAAAHVLVELLGAANDKYEAEVRRINALRKQELDALCKEHDHRRKEPEPVSPTPISTCDKCGARYPSAPLGVIHKCQCSGGMMVRDG